MSSCQLGQCQCSSTSELLCSVSHSRFSSDYGAGLSGIISGEQVLAADRRRAGQHLCRLSTGAAPSSHQAKDQGAAAGESPRHQHTHTHTHTHRLTQRRPPSSPPTRPPTHQPVPSKIKSLHLVAWSLETELTHMRQPVHPPSRPPTHPPLRPSAASAGVCAGGAAQIQRRGAA